MNTHLSTPIKTAQMEAPRLVCHGSRVVVESPRILETRYTKDFGPGFYCTVLRDQAVRWAVRFHGARMAFPQPRRCSMNKENDLFYQSRGYLAECYRAGRILAA